MQHKAVYLLFCKFTLHVSGVKNIHHQENTKLHLQPPVQFIFIVKLPSSKVAKITWPLWREHVDWTCRTINRLLCLNKVRPTWWHLLYYVNLLLKIFQMLIHPSSGACDYLVRYCVRCNNATSSRKLLKMDVLTSEVCWAVNWHNKASVI